MDETTKVTSHMCHTLNILCTTMDETNQVYLTHVCQTSHNFIFEMDETTKFTTNMYHTLHILCTKMDENHKSLPHACGHISHKYYTKNG